MAISFNGISATLRTPGSYIEYDNSRAVQGSPEIPEVMLVIGQRLTAGTVAEATLTAVPSSDDGEVYFGHGSIIASMIETIKATSPSVELWAIALDDASGTPATGTFPFAGTATANGEVVTYIAGHRIVTAVTSGDAHTVVGPAVAAAITAYVAEHNVPVSAADSSGTVTVTCLHDGTLGNGIDLRLNYQQGEALPAGITCVPVGMASGATDPDMADAIAALGNNWFTTIVSAYADDTNQDLLEDELLDRWGPMVMQDGHSFIGAIGNQAALTALGNARNSQFTTLVGGGLSPTPAWIWASDAAAVDAAEPDPARPRQTLLLPNCKPPALDAVFTQAERNTLLYDGVSTFTTDKIGNCYVERFITTYQTNSLSVPDSSYLDITTMRTLSYLRYSWRSRVNLKFPRHKLVDDGTDYGPGQAIVTPNILRAEALALFRDTWEVKGLVEGWEQYKKDLKVERNAEDPNRVDMRMSPDLANQFRVLAGQIQFLL